MLHSTLYLTCTTVQLLQQRTIRLVPVCAQQTAVITAASSVQVAILPNAALQEIVQVVTGFPWPNLANLRLCSTSWRNVCDAEVHFVRCKAVRLTAAVPFLSRLPKLQHLNIRGDAVKAITIKGNAFRDLEGSALKRLTLAGFLAEEKARDFNLTVESIGDILLPWRQSLEVLCLDYCVLGSVDGPNNFDSPGYFCSFANLTRLMLTGLSAKPKLTMLNLAGCTKLCNLDCSNSGFTCLDVTGCKQLRSLHCTQNKISALDVSDCLYLTRLNCGVNALATLTVGANPALLDMQCFNNNLIKLDLSSCTSLKSLICHHNKLERLILPDRARFLAVDCGCNAADPAVFDDDFMGVSCDASSFPLLENARRVDIKVLDLTGVVDLELAGFVKLKCLSCSLGSIGSIDLTGCKEVQLSIHSHTTCMTLLSRTAVQRLKLSGVFCLTDFSGFTMLTKLELVCCASEPAVLDFSVLWGLLELSLIHGLERSLLTAIDVSGCTSLRKLHCENLSLVSKLDLASCVALHDLKCIKSSLLSLNVSCCLKLISLDVSGSEVLESLVVSSNLNLKQIIYNDCPGLKWDPLSKHAGERLLETIQTTLYCMCFETPNLGWN